MKKLEKSIAGIASAFLSIAAYFVAHFEAPEYPWLWALVFSALLFSFPSVAGWARTWTGNNRLSAVKALGFTALLEGVLVAAHSPWLNVSALVLLAGINSLVAVAAMSASKKFGSVAAVTKRPVPGRQRPARALPVASANVVG